MDTIEELRKLQRDHLLKARNIAAAAEAAQRDMTVEETKALEDAIRDAKAVGDTIKARVANKKNLDEVEELLTAEQAHEVNAEHVKSAEAKFKGSIGAQFTQSAGYKGMIQRHGNGAGVIPDSAKGITTDRVNVAGGLKSLVASGDRTSTSGANILVQPQDLGVVPGLPYQAPKLRQLITNTTTNTDRVEYAQQVEFGASGTTNAAKAVKEATTAAGPTANTTSGVLELPEGSGVKPESGMAFRKASADVITVAHWMPATKRSLSDASQIRSLIDQFLSRGIDAEVDRLILKGNKTSPVGDEEWNGILNTSGVQSQAYSNSIPETIRKAISLATSKGAVVSGVVMSPEVDEALDLLKDTQNRYYGNGPFGSGPSTIWGRPRIVVPALSAENKFILGDFSQCILWDREDTTITATDAHADFFIRNLVAILAEARAAFGIFNPSMLVVGATA